MRNASENIFRPRKNRSADKLNHFPEPPSADQSKKNKEIIKDLQRIKRNLENESAMIDMIIHETENEYIEEERIKQQLVNSEKSFLFQRKTINKLLNRSENKNIESVYSKAGSAFSDVIKFKKMNNYYYLTTPALISKRTIAKRSDAMLDDFIRVLVREKSTDFIKKNNINEIFTHATIIFIHHVNQNEFMTDTDNFEIKKPIDGMSGILFSDDSSEYIHICQFTKVNKNDPEAEEYTEIYVFQGHDMYKIFNEYLDSIQKNQDNHIG